MSNKCNKKRAIYIIRTTICNLNCGTAFDNSGKKLYKYTIMRELILLLSLTLALATTNFAQAQNGENNRGINITASVNRDITPDEIFLSILITELESKGKITVEQQEQQMIKTLEKLNIDVEKNLTVDDMESSLQSYFLKRDNILANKRYTLKLSTAKETTTALDALNNIGISNVSISKTALSKELEQKVKSELLTEATVRTKENATILAEAAGCKVGKVLYIENYSSSASRAVYNTNTMLVKSASNIDGMQQESTEIQIRKTNISATVKCLYEIE